MLQFHGSAALEVRYITVGGKSYGVPEADGRLNTQLVLKGGQSHLLLLALVDGIGTLESQCAIPSHVQRIAQIWIRTIKLSEAVAPVVFGFFAIDPNRS